MPAKTERATRVDTMVFMTVLPCGNGWTTTSSFTAGTNLRCRTNDCCDAEHRARERSLDHGDGNGRYVRFHARAALRGGSHSSPLPCVHNPCVGQQEVWAVVESMPGDDKRYRFGPFGLYQEVEGVNDVGMLAAVGDAIPCAWRRPGPAASRRLRRTRQSRIPKDRASHGLPYYPNVS